MSHEAYMKRALDLASLGLGSVSPNPMVGCVIVCNEKIIGEGWHKKYGGPHAEVEAVNSIQEKSLIPEATCYVTLEPCSHYGKTPPCADLLIKMGFRKVVIANTDPNPQVNGKGISKLKAAGIEVITGILEKEACKLNKRFFASIEKNRPYIILKWAVSRDGYVAQTDGTPVQMSGKLAQMHAHKWRTEEDAILVGASTVINDNPLLTSRHWKGRDPQAFVWDPEGRTGTNSRLYQKKAAATVFGGPAVENRIALGQDDKNVEFLIAELQNRKIGSLIVEGGPRLHKLFLDKNCFDEIRVIESKGLILNEGIPSAQIPVEICRSATLDLQTDYIHFFSKDFQPF